MIPIGTIVTVIAPGSRESEGEPQQVPAIVLRAWPNGQLDLYAFHFQGSPLLLHAQESDVQVLLNFQTIWGALAEHEKALITLKPGWRPKAAEKDPRFTLVDK